MDPELDGYISLEEETTTSTPQRSDSPKEVVPSLPTLADCSTMTAARQNWWNPGYLRNPASMDMGLPGTTDTGVAGNLGARRECPPKEGSQRSSSIQAAHHLLSKRLANLNLLFEVLNTKSFAKT